MRFLLSTLLALLLMVGAAPALAIQAAGLHVDAMEGAGWRLQGLTLRAGLPGVGKDHAELHIARLDLPPPIGTVRNLRLDCPHLQLTAQRIACHGGRLRAAAGWLKDAPVPASFEYIPAEGRLSGQIDKLPMLGGAVSATGRFTGAGWRLQIHGGIDAKAALPLLAAWPDLPQLSGSGQLQLQASVHGGQTLAGQFQVTAQSLSVSDQSGQYASDKLNAQLAGLFSRTSPGDGWVLQGKLTADGGQVYMQPVFVDAGAAPLQLSGHAMLMLGQLQLDDLQLQQKGGLQASGQLTLAMKADAPLRGADIRVENVQLPLAFTTWVQPFMPGTALAKLQTTGALRGRLQVGNGTLRALNLTLDDVSVNDADQRYAVSGVNGALHWRADADDPEASPSQLRWAGGSFYRVPLGAGDTRFRASGRNLALLAPLRLPLAGGALVVEQFSGSDLGGDAMQLHFNGKVDQINLAALGKAVGWPEFGGTLSGELPQLGYADSALTLGGTLQAQVFDGKVQMQHFYLKDPFGELPRLGATLHARNLDLEQITQAFSFGRIEGRLDADVDKLRMLDWQPVSFAARLYTPPDDSSRHRISQQAVDKLASIGAGGASAVLSGTFLRFFESFRYDRLGLSCVLHAGVCTVQGIAPHKKGGYYIVKGSGLPRIDVVGYVHQVQWQTLVQQLKQATEGGAPVVK